MMEVLNARHQLYVVRVCVLAKKSYMKISGKAPQHERCTIYVRASAKAHTNTNSNHSVSPNANAVIDAVQKIMGEELSQSARERWCLRLDVELGRGPLVRPRRSTQLPSRSHASGWVLDRCHTGSTPYQSEVPVASSWPTMPAIAIIASLPS